MKTENIAPTIKTNLDTKSEKYLKNKKMMHEKLEKKIQTIVMEPKLRRQFLLLIKLQKI